MYSADYVLVSFLEAWHTHCAEGLSRDGPLAQDERR